MGDGAARPGAADARQAGAQAGATAAALARVDELLDDPVFLKPLVELVRDSITARRFCGIGLVDTTPHSLTVMGLRRRFGPNTVRRLNEVLLAVVAGGATRTHVQEGALRAVQAALGLVAAPIAGLGLLGLALSAVLFAAKRICLTA